MERAGEGRGARKLHLGVDEATGEIVAVVTTQADVADGTAFPSVLAQVEPPAKQCSCDGAYDWWEIWRAIEARGAIATIPPRAGAVIRQQGNSMVTVPNLPCRATKRCGRYGAAVCVVGSRKVVTRVAVWLRPP